MRDLNDLYSRYLDRKPGRGADQVYAASLKDVPEPRVAEARRGAVRKGRLSVAVGLFAVLIAAGAGVAGMRSQNTDASVASDGPKVDEGASDELPIEEMIANRQRLEEQQRSGWIPFGGVRPGVEGAKVPDGWARYPGDGANPFDGAGRFEVFDAPEGVVVGYFYQGLGYVPAEVANSPEFDAAKQRESLGVCAPEDQECKSAQMDEALAEIEARESGG